MSVNRVEEAEVDRLGAVVFEQRRLGHMLRQRGAEIEQLIAERERLTGKVRKALAREEELRKQVREFEAETASLSAARDRLNAELKQAQYEARRAQRRVEKAEREQAEALERAGRREEESRERIDALAKRQEEDRQQIDALVGARDRVAAELAQAGEEAKRAERGIAEAVRERESLNAELKQAQSEAWRAERRVEKAGHEAVEAERRSRLQLDSLAAELRAGLAARDDALAARDAEHDQRVNENEQRVREGEEAAEELHAVERTGRELGWTQREVERLKALEREREVALADSANALDLVAAELRGVRRSRSWRWGQAVARAARLFSFRRRSRRSAIDAALERLEAGGDAAPDGRAGA